MTQPPEKKASVPDEKRRRKWRRRLCGLFIATLMVAGVLTGTEAYRQTRVSTARAEFASEVRLAQAHYAGVDDWPQWYRDQLPPGCNHEALEVWVDHCDDSGAYTSEIVHWVLFFDDVDSLETETPTEDQMRQFILETAPLAEEARALLRYDHLSRLPQLHDSGFSSVRAIPVISAFRLLEQRSFVFRYLGELDNAWLELSTGLRLVQKWDHPCFSVDFALTAGIERLFHHALAEVAQQGRPRIELVEPLVRQPEIRPELTREALVHELAQLSRLFEFVDPDEPGRLAELREESELRWFDYLPLNLSWERRKDTFNARVLMFEAATEYVRQARLAIENPSGTISDVTATHVYSPGIFGKLPSRLQELAVLRKGTSLLSRILLAKQNGELESAIAQAEIDYPDHEVSLDAESIVIRVRYSKRLAAELPCEDVSEEEFYQVYEPVRLPLKP